MHSTLQITLWSPGYFQSSELITTSVLNGNSSQQRRRTWKRTIHQNEGVFCLIDSLEWHCSSPLKVISYCYVSMIVDRVVGWLLSLLYTNTFEWYALISVMDSILQYYLAILGITLYFRNPSRYPNPNRFRIYTDIVFIAFRYRIGKWGEDRREQEEALRMNYRWTEKCFQLYLLKNGMKNFNGTGQL